MIDSRKIEDLHPAARSRVSKFIESCKADGITLLITQTYRDIEKQNDLFKVGRRGVAGERTVTNARGGESFHNYRCAVDVVPIVYGKALWDTSDPLWRRVGEIGESCGLEWSGRWTGKMREMAHFQFTGGLKLTDLKAGKVPVE